jgi:hypothetical protein
MRRGTTESTAALKGWLGRALRGWMGWEKGKISVQVPWNRTQTNATASPGSGSSRKGKSSDDLEMEG